VNGNWKPAVSASTAKVQTAASAGAAKAKAAKSPVSLKGTAALSIGKAVRISEDHFSIPVMVKVQKGQLFSAELALDYAKSAFEAIAVHTGSLSKDAMLASNLEKLGQISIGLASSSPMKGAGELVSVVFKQKKEKVGSPRMLIRKAHFNDGQMKAAISAKDSAGAKVQEEQSEPLASSAAPGVVPSSAAGNAAQGTITLTSPVGGEKWTAGSTRKISWSYAGGLESLINLELLKSGLLVTPLVFEVAPGKDGKGSYEWEVPAALAPGDDYRWTQLSGEPVALSNPSAPITTFVAPEHAAADERLVFQLTVQDAGGLGQSARMVIAIAQKSLE
jgi:hypothetical protein